MRSVLGSEGDRDWSEIGVDEQEERDWREGIFIFIFAVGEKGFGNGILVQALRWVPLLERERERGGRESV